MITSDCQAELINLVIWLKKHNGVSKAKVANNEFEESLVYLIFENLSSGFAHVRHLLQERFMSIGCFFVNF